MRKLSLVFLIVYIAFAAAPFSAFANSGVAVIREPVPFVMVTAENDDFQPDNEYSITFAKNLTIKAESVKGAKVIVTVTPDESLGIEPEVYEEVVIGATLKFVQPVALYLGDNLIEIDIERDGYEPTQIQAIVKRKDVTIQESLKNLIVIPGQIR